MDSLRVYEAARKLNLETTELMRLLAEEGVDVTSPIAFIDVVDFDKVAAKVGGRGQSAPEPSPSPVAEPAPVIPFARKGEGERTGAAPEERDPEEVNHNPTPPAESTERPHHPPSHPRHHAHHPPKGSAAAAPLSYLAIGFASVALIVSFGLYVSIKSHGGRLDELAAAATVVEGRVADANNEALRAQAMAQDNFAAIGGIRADLNAGETARIKGELARRSAALAEAARAARPDIADRIAGLALRLQRLAGSL
jgi:hypothetical protein